MFLGKPQKMPATFILAPMAMALREQGVPIKIVYLGHRDGSTRGGHLCEAIVRPTLELMLEQAGALERRFDPASGLALIAPE